jgi:hypothetical protein
MTQNVLETTWCTWAACRPSISLASSLCFFLILPLQHVTLGPFTQPRLAIPDPASTVRGHATLGLSPSRSLSANRTPRPNFWRASPCDCDLWRLPQTPLPPLTAPSLPIFPSSGVSAPRVSNPESSILLRFTKASGIKRLPSSFKHLLFVNRASALKQQTLEPLTAKVMVNCQNNSLSRRTTRTEKDPSSNSVA